MSLKIALNYLVPSFVRDIYSVADYELAFSSKQPTKDNAKIRMERLFSLAQGAIASYAFSRLEPELPNSVLQTSRTMKNILLAAHTQDFLVIQIFMDCFKNALDAFKARQSMGVAQSIGLAILASVASSQGMNNLYKTLPSMIAEKLA